MVDKDNQRAVFFSKQLQQSGEGNAVNGERAVLHVDDDPLLTRLVAERLGGHGYRVTSLNDPRQALKELMRNQWRVVLLDIDMPETNGLDLIREIKAYDGGIQVIMLTGIVTLGSVLQSYRWGAEACLLKPLREIGPLLEALEDTFRKIDRWSQTLKELALRRRVESHVLSE